MRRPLLAAVALSAALASCSTNEPAPAAEPMTVAIVGDSYTDGTALGGMKEKNWTVIMGQMLERDGYDVTLVVEPGSGSGYVAKGWRNLTFGELAAMSVPKDADVVLIFGSVNDPASGANQAQVKAASTDAYAWVRKHTRDATLLVVGPAAVSENVPPELVDTAATLRGTARRADATFVDPLKEKWFFGKDSVLIGIDGLHPTDDGHRYMAVHMLPHVEKALDERLASEN